MGWFDWLWLFLGWKSDVKILFLGLDNAGKTTLFHSLRTGSITAAEPTKHAVSTSLRLGSVTFHTFDIGGHVQMRRMWADYFSEVGGVVFMVDAAEPERFDEARKVLAELLAAPEMATVPIMILGNKIDLTNRAVSEDELKARLNIFYQTTGKKYVDLGPRARPLEVFMCSVVYKQGYAEGFNWLKEYVC